MFLLLIWHVGIVLHSEWYCIGNEHCVFTLEAYGSGSTNRLFYKTASMCENQRDFPFHVIRKANWMNEPTSQECIF